MSLFSLFKKSDEEIALVIDVAYGSVGGALVQFSHSKLPYIIHTKRLLLSAEDTDDNRSLAATHKKLEDIVGYFAGEGLKYLHYQKVTNKDIHHVLCVLDTPWVITETNTIQTHEENPIIFSKKFTDTLLENEKKVFMGKIGEMEAGYATVKPIVIEKKIVQTKLNGYIITNPYDKKSNRIETSLFLSATASKTVEKVESTVHHYFNAKKIEFLSFPLVAFNTIRDIFKEESSFHVIDIREENGSLSIIKDGVLRDTHSFPVGSNFLIDRVSKDLEVTEEIGLSYLKLYIEGKAETAIATKMGSVLRKIEKEWMAKFAACLKQISYNKSLSTKSFLIADSDTGPIFSLWLNRQDGIVPETEEDTPEKNVILISKEILTHFSTWNETASVDCFLGLEAVFFSKIFNLPPQ